MRKHHPSGPGSIDQRGERGSSLLLALVYIVAVSMVVLALANWATSSLKSTTVYSNSAAFDSALRSITELGIQNIRYSPSFYLTDDAVNSPGPCWGTTESSDTYDYYSVQYSVAVWCSTHETSQTVTTSNTRTVTLYACPASITSGSACKSTPSVTAVVTFGDYNPAGSTSFTTTCTQTSCGCYTYVAPPTTTTTSPTIVCGFTATQKSWTWGSYPASIPTPSSTTTTTIGPAYQLTFATSPVASGEGVSFPTNPTVAVEDSSGNIVTGDSSHVTIGITQYTAGTSGGSTQGTLSGCAQSGEASGGISFTNCSISGVAAAGTYTLTASEAGLQSVSTTVTISAGAASSLAFSTSPPASGVAGSSLTAFTVKVTDANGNLVTTGTGSTDTISIAPATGPGGIASGSTAVAVGGVASFSSTTLNTSGAYTFTATDTTVGDTGFASATTPGTTTIGSAGGSKLVWGVSPPATGTHGVNLTTFSVYVEDQYNNIVTTNTGATDTITLSLVTRPGTGAISSGGTVTASGGVATFNAVKLNVAGTYTFKATDTTSGDTGFTATPTSSSTTVN